MGKRARKHDATASANDLTDVDTDSQDDEPVRLPRGLPLEHPAPQLQDVPVKQVEILCRNALLDGYIPFGIFEEICNAMQSDPLRSSALTRRGNPPFAFTTGAYYHAGSIGLRRTTKSYPWTTALLANMVRACTHSTFSTVMLSRNVHMRTHADKNNRPGSRKILIPCSKFRKGHFWLQHEDGSVPSPQNTRRGNLHRLQLPCLEFDPRCPHATGAWKGDRVILAAYTTNKIFQLRADDQRKLQELGLALLNNLARKTRTINLNSGYGTADVSKKIVIT